MIKFQPGDLIRASSAGHPPDGPFAVMLYLGFHKRSRGDVMAQVMVPRMNNVVTWFYFENIEKIE